MILHPPQGQIRLTRGKTDFTFFPSGDAYAFMHDGLMINGFRGSPSGGSVNQLYLRRREGNAVTAAAPLLGLAAAPAVSYHDHALRQSGRALDVAYTVTFHLAGEFVWFWEVQLCGEGTFDLLYGQDIGLAERGMVLTNELYAAQYLGHTVLTGEHGCVVCSRQNLPQAGGRTPYLQQGMLRGEAVAYSTDGTQFFGLSYKRDDIPAALTRDLPSENYQYEFSYTGLQSRPFALDGAQSFLFYGLLRPNHPDAVRSLAFEDALVEAEAALSQQKQPWHDAASFRLHPAIGKPYASPTLSPAEIDARWPARRLEERAEGVLQSFFADDGAHVVLQDKELRSERPHGTILMNAVSQEGARPDMLASTNYMYGLFAAQTVVGNTNLHKALSAARGMLNVQKHNGLRAYIQSGNQYRLLTMPAAYSMTVNSAQWLYRLPDGDTLEITAFTSAFRPDWTLEVRSGSGKPYVFMLSLQTVMGEQEWERDIRAEQARDALRLRPGQSDQATPYPDWHFDLRVSGTRFSWHHDGVFFADGAARDETLLTMVTEPSASFSLTMHGALEDEPLQTGALPARAEEAGAFASVWQRMTCALALEHDSRDIARLRAMIPWYVHNASIHFASPHGLEQPGGAAWGTRDVCQGPFELFAAHGHFPLMRGLLLAVFSHQSHASGEWPQWFMFDRYTIAATECHGDVFLWPLKCIADYLRMTGDHSILQERLPYADEPSGGTLLEHIERAAAHFQDRFVAGTALLSYAGGDWDDTLQPVQAEMKERLVSSWTQAIGCQVAEGLAAALEMAAPDFAQALAATARRMRQDFTRYLLIDGQIAGFVLHMDTGFVPMLHPADTLTGLRCRLIPLTRSILAELVDPEQAKRNLAQIDRYLRCPDGIRLMDKPAPYTGGVAHLFRRAEQAANVGREISLQYVHAHIRYVEAMAMLGEAERAWNGLMVIAPPMIQESVRNAVARQSNLYFSSSDGAFADRYRYAQDYERLRDGSIPVKGGWRLYSSGPGIYLRTLLSYVIGIRYEAEGLVIDPVLPPAMDGLRVSLECYGQPLDFHFHIDGEAYGTVEITCGGKPIVGTERRNRYRQAGVLVARETLRALPDVVHVRLAAGRKAR